MKVMFNYVKHLNMKHLRSVVCTEFAEECVFRDGSDGVLDRDECVGVSEGLGEVGE